MPKIGIILDTAKKKRGSMIFLKIVFEVIWFVPIFVDYFDNHLIFNQ